MFEMGSTSLGITLLILGFSFSLLTLILLRLVPKIRPKTLPASLQVPPGDLPTHQDAVFMVQPGGRIAFLNQAARTQFELWEVEPSLEALARRSRPGDIFWSLCASEGQARFSMDGRPFEGTSYAIPNGQGNTMLLSLRPIQAISLHLDGQGANGRTTEILTKLNMAMTAELDLEPTIRAVLQSVEQLIPTDFTEITIWDPDGQCLIPYRFIGIEGFDRRLQRTSDRYKLNEGYSGRVAGRMEPLLVSDVDTYRDTRPIIDRRLFPFQSYLGMPLHIGDRLIGTLELTSRSKNAYTENDIHTLSLLSGQAAIAIHNALIYKAEQRRAEELSGLANLAKAISAVRDYDEFFGHLVQGITPLLDIEIAGFLIYDEENRVLEAVNPFIGVPPQFVKLYKTPIPVDSPAEKVWLQGETIIARVPADDPALIDLGLDHSARAAGFRDTVLVPLASGGHSIGYLQAANKRDNTPLNQDDLRLLEIIALQAAAIIENAALIQQSVSRALRAEALRRIASLCGSSATLDEIFKYSLVELARLIEADFAGIFLLEENLGELQVHKESVYRVRPEQLPLIRRLPISDENFRHTVTASKRPFISGDALGDDRILPIFSTLIQPFKARSVIDVPLVRQDRGAGEILLGSRVKDAFSQSDVQLAATVASQLAVALERSQLAAQTNVDLHQRVEILTTITRINREMSTSQHLPHLLQLTLDEAQRNTSADSGSLLLFTPGESSSAAIQVSHQVGVSRKGEFTHLERLVIQNNRPLIVQDFQDQAEPRNAGLHPNIWKPPRVGVRSALIVPITHQGKIIGLVHLYAAARARFDSAALAYTQSLAVQAAIAIENTHRYQENALEIERLNRRIEALTRVFENAQNTRLKSLPDSLGEITTSIQAATPFRDVTISTYHADDHTLRAATPPGEQPADQLRPVPWEELRAVLQPEFSHGRSFYIPPGPKPPLSDRAKSLFQAAGADPTEAILLTPIFNTRGEPLGIIQAAPSDVSQPPDPTSLENLELFASQAALAIESRQEQAALEAQVKTLREQLDLYRDTQERIPRLVRENQEKTAMLAAMTESTQRTQAGLGIIELINQQPDRQAVLAALGMAFVSHMGLEVVLVAEPGPGGPQLVHVLGRELSERTHPEALLGQRNPLRQVLQDGAPILVPNLGEDPSWATCPLLLALDTTGFICLPVRQENRIDAAVLAVSGDELPPFSEIDQRLFELLSAQTGIAINNLNILDETERRLLEVNLLLDFSRQLGSLEPGHILQTLIDSSFKVAKGASAGFVALLEPGDSALVPHAARGYRDNDAIPRIRFQTDTLPGVVCAQGQAARIDDLNFAQHYPLDAQALLHYRGANDGILPVSCLVVPIQSGDHALGVIVLDNFRQEAAFSGEDQALVTSLALQTALSLENARLYQAAENRADQLQALSTVASTITHSLEPDDLIDSLLDKLGSVVPNETATLWLRDGDTLSIRSARGFENSADLVGLSTTTQDSRLFRELIETNLPISVDDVRTDNRFPDLETERLSWLGVPLITTGEIIGLIALEKQQAGFYTLEQIQVASTFCSQAAIAFENASLYQQSLLEALELDQRSQRLALLNRFSNQISAVLDPDFILKTTLDELIQALPASVISIVLWESGQPVLRAETSYQAADPDQTEALPRPLPPAPLFERLAQTLGVFNAQDVSLESELAPLADFFTRRKTIALLVLPLATGDVLHGLVLVHNDQPYYFSADDIDLGRIITNQAAIAVQNAISFEATTRLTEELEARVAERTAQLENEYLREQSLLRIMRELSASLDLDQVLNQTLVILNETVGAEHSTILLVHHPEGTFYYRASVGYDHSLPPGGQLSSLKLDEGLAGWVVQNRKSAVVSNVQEDERWQPIEGYSTNYTSAIVVPLILGEEILGVVTLGHSLQGAFTGEDQELAQAAAMQMAVAINNAELFNLIRDQAEGLGTMLRSQQIEASRSMSVLEAVADGVLVTDDHSVITLFNQSAQNILDLKHRDVIGKSLDDFTGLFGHAAQTWMDTIRNWSEDPTSFEIGDTYTDQITLDNQRVVSIHLAPVAMRNEFLGSVSTFRDITHQVEVDRLKSEFVATVSHELRTPMTSIKGYVDVLLMGAAGDLSEQQSNFLDIVKINTERLNILVNDLLDVSRIEAGKVELAIQPLDMRLLIEEVVREQVLRAEKEGKPMSIHYDLPPNLPRVPGDEERVRQILDNLVINAYQYTPGEGQIDIRLQVHPAEIQVDIQDNGIGIPPADHEKIFERFYRGEDPLVLASGGNGLGLSIVRQITDMHHGRLWLTSEGIPGKGSTFSFTLPLHRPLEEVL